VQHHHKCGQLAVNLCFFLTGLQGKVALVTGATSGIGLETAAALAGALGGNCCKSAQVE
jgi:hypothetical protein